MIRLKNLSSEEEDEKAIAYIKKHKKELCEYFASDEIYSSFEKPTSIFMAGTPGAGKTETAISLNKELNTPAVHIDADSIKAWIPEYTGKKSFVFQGASAIGVDILYGHILKKNKSVILDATFANYEKAHQNVWRSVKRDRPTQIFYVYQDFDLSWQFTIAREKQEGRHVPKEVFQHALKNSGKNVLKIKKEFGNSIAIYLVEKNFKGQTEKIYDNISIDKLKNFLK
jgi:UDP-N-acetylglucosamine kinase